jgi:hypothetical protein
MVLKASWVHLFRNSAFSERRQNQERSSLARFGAPPSTVENSTCFCEILASQKIASSQTEQETPPNPRSTACIRPKSYPGLKHVFFFSETDGSTDVFFLPSLMLMLKEGDVLLQARRHVIKESFGQQVNVCCDVRHAWAFILHV